MCPWLDEAGECDADRLIEQFVAEHCEQSEAQCGAFAH
jgi:hypothetical protein